MNQQQLQNQVLTQEGNILDQAIEQTRQESSFSKILLDDTMFAKAMQIAEMMAGGKVTIPDHLKGNFGDCASICLQALAWKMNPWLVAQKTHLVGGKLGYEAQLINAVVCTSGAIDGRFQFEFSAGWERLAGKVKMGTSAKGNQIPTAGWDKNDEQGLWVKAGAVIAGEQEVTWSQEIYLSGVAVRNSTLWVTDPQQQICYLGVKKWARLHTPDAILGVYSADELPQQSYSLEEAGIEPKKPQSAIRKRKPAPAAAQPAEAEPAQPTAEQSEDELNQRLDRIAGKLLVEISAANDYEKLESVVPDITASLPPKSRQIEAVRAAYREQREELDRAAAEQGQQG